MTFLDTVVVAVFDRLEQALPGFARGRTFARRIVHREMRARVQAQVGDAPSSE